MPLGFTPNFAERLQCERIFVYRNYGKTFVLKFLHHSKSDLVSKKGRKHNECSLTN